MGAKLLSDEPLSENSTRVDSLEFEAYASVIADGLVATPGPLTVGVFGDWGVGKTSLLRSIEKKLTTRNEVVCIWLNAWRYEREGHPIVPLIAKIVKGLDSKKSRLGRAAKELDQGLSALAYGFSLGLEVGVPLLGKAQMAFSGKDAAQRYERLATSHLLDRSLYFDAFELLTKASKKLVSSNKRLVILIDDLDRCLPDRAVDLLESIKLLLNHPGFSFVLAVARPTIEAYVRHVHAERFGIKDFRGETYLDKFFQLPFPIPKHDERIKTLCSDLLHEIGDDASDALKTVLPLMGVMTENNPRNVVRLINALLVDKEVHSKLSSGDLDVPVTFFAVSRVLRSRWPSVYDVLEESKQMRQAVIGGNLHEESIRPLLKQLLPYVDRREIEVSLRRSPALREILTSQPGVDWLEDDDRRAAACRYLFSRQPSGTTQTEVASLRLYLSHDVKDIGTDGPVYVTVEQIRIEVGPQLVRAAGSATDTGDFRQLMGQSQVFVLIAGDQISDAQKWEAEWFRESVDSWAMFIVSFGKANLDDRWVTRNFREENVIVTNEGLGSLSDSLEPLFTFLRARRARVAV